MRIVIFSDYDSTAGLVEATITATEGRPATEVVAVYTGVPRLLEATSRASSLTRPLSALARGERPRRPLRLREVCDRHGVPLLAVAERDPNRPEFLREMVERFHPDVALSYWSSSIFGEAWLATFDRAVNFHDGRLPQYRGVAATAMEIYAGETEAGYAFHLIDEGIDTGPLLVTGSVPASGRRASEVLEAKLAAAASRVGEVLDLVEAGDPGWAPDDEGSYFSQATLDSLTSIEDPSSVGRDELQRRMDALGGLRLELPGGPAMVTSLAPKAGRGWPLLVTADGPVRVREIDRMPAVIKLVGRAVTRSGRRLFGR